MHPSAQVEDAAGAPTIAPNTAAAMEGDPVQTRWHCPHPHPKPWCRADRATGTAFITTWPPSTGSSMVGHSPSAPLALVSRSCFWGAAGFNSQGGSTSNLCYRTLLCITWAWLAGCAIRQASTMAKDRVTVYPMHQSTGRWDGISSECGAPQQMDFQHSLIT